MFEDMRQMLDDEEAFSVLSEMVWLVLGTIYGIFSECIVGPCFYCVSRGPLCLCSIPCALGSAVGGVLTVFVNIIQKIILAACGPLGPTIGTLAALLWAFGDTMFGFIRGFGVGVLLTWPCCWCCGIGPIAEGILYAIPRSLQVVGSAPQLVGLVGQAVEVIGVAGGGGITALMGGGLLGVGGLLAILVALLGGGLLGVGGLLVAILGGCATVLFGGIGGIPIIGGPLATLCGGVASIPVAIGGLLTTVISAVSGIPIIGGPLATLCGGLAASLGCVVV